jgi:hypothetical protein
LHLWKCETSHGEGIFTQAFYFDSVPPASIRLRLVRDEVLVVE